MARFTAIVFITASAGLLLSAGNIAWAADLIEPTQTLSGAAKSEGKLAVFSEPRGLPVALDGLSIGKTPTSIKEVKAGVHHLRVASSETDITIAPGQTMQVSLYKGSFIRIPEPTEKPSQPPATAVTPTPESEPSPARTEEQPPPPVDPMERYRLLKIY